MQNIQARESQCMADLLMQACGNAYLLVEAAMMNNIGITESLEVGRFYILPDVDKQSIVRAFPPPYYPACDLAEADEEAIPLTGIDYDWTVGTSEVR